MTAAPLTRVLRSGLIAAGLVLPSQAAFGVSLGADVRPGD